MDRPSIALLELLSAALDALEEDEVPMSALGSLLSTSYLTKPFDLFRVVERHG